MVKYLPPPTKFGPASNAQPKPAVAVAGRLHVPPTTRFGAMGGAPVPMLTRSFPTAIQRMQAEPKTFDKKGELVVYDNCVLAKTGGQGVAEFAGSLKGNALFLSALDWARKRGKKITVYTGFHGSGGDETSAEGMFCERFNEVERGMVAQSDLVPLVNLIQIDEKINARTLVLTTIGTGFVFYAWCFSDALIPSEYKKPMKW